MIRRSFQILAFILFAFQTTGQTLDKDYQFLPIEADFTQNTITAILKDHHGFLWIGTRNGLNRYDGLNVVSYQHSNQDSSSICGNFIETLYLDADNNLWIGTLGKGICRYEESTNSFVSTKKVFQDYDLNNNTVNTIFEDNNKMLWIGTSELGLLRWDRTNDEVIQYRYNQNDPLGISANNVTDIVTNDANSLWIATWGGGLNLFDTNTKRFIHYTHDPKNPNSLVSNVIRVMSSDKDGKLLIGTDKGLSKLFYDEKEGYIFEKIALKQAKETEACVLSILEGKNGDLWIGTENEGLCKANLEEQSIAWYVNDPKKEYSIKNNSIWSLLEDESGILWVGTYNRGLFKIDEKSRKFLKYKNNPYSKNSLSAGAVSSFAEDQQGNVWISTDGGGLNYWHVKKQQFNHYKKSNAAIPNEILSLKIDSKNNLWLGTWEGGLYKKQARSATFLNFPLEHNFTVNHGSESIFDILEDSQNNLWFLLFGGGVIRYNPISKRSTTFSADGNGNYPLSSNLVTTIIEDYQNRIWIGTFGGGLNRITAKGGHFVVDQPSEKSPLLDNTIYSLHNDDKNGIWIGTSSGLNHYDFESKEFEKYGKQNGFADEVIQSIQKDENGHLRISTNRGLCRFDPKNKTTINFDLNDGLQSMEFFGGSSLKLASGDLLFGGIEGFNLISPSLVIDKNDNALLYISSFKIFNEESSTGKIIGLGNNMKQIEKIELNHNQNDFRIEFAQLNFRQSSKNTYSYMLENYDKQWKDTGTQRIANYANVPPSNYVFKVKGTNNNGNWSENQIRFNITIHPAWYATYWALSCYFLVVLFSLIWTFYTIIHRERLKTKLNLEHMELTKMQDLDQMKSSFFANISHEFRSPLTLIIGPLQSMLEKNSFLSSKKEVSMMLRNTEGLLNLINQLLELSKLESGKMRPELVTEDVIRFIKPSIHSFVSMAARKNVRYQISLPNKSILLSFDKDKLKKILMNLLSNAFKYSKEYGQISIELKDKKDRIVLEVKDDGIGIPQDDKAYIFNRYYRVRDKRSQSSTKGTGLGLSLTKELVELHHGKIDFQSEENKGTAFQVHLYKGKNHFDAEDFVDYQEEQDEQTILPVTYDSDDDMQTTHEESESNLPLVLVIEDNNDIREYIKDILSQDYQIMEAENGVDGIDMAKNQLPDAIISDVMMPGKDGFEVSKTLKSNSKTSHIPFILLTAKASKDSALSGLETGADHYLTKPFEPKMLLLILKNVLFTRDNIKSKLINKNPSDIQPKNIKVTTPEDEFITRAVQIIEANMANSSFYVDDLGKELGLSRMQLYRRLKDNVGQSANEFIRTIRIKRAAQLLEQGNLNISEITYMVGFNDLQYFRNSFKKQYGVNPSEYMTNSGE